MSAADTVSPPPTPQRIGAYELIYKIAEGGMGAVHQARHVGTGAIVAIKIIPTETARNPLLLKRFEQEFKAASLIDHPNVVKALDYCGTGPTPFLVMEFVNGESLGQRVERAGPVEEQEAVRLISQVCEGLHRAHKQGLIHRDVKPDNILVNTEGTAKLTDLGLVKDVEAELGLTRTGRGLGTPHFMAPEQFRNAKNADVRCDVYSLGATLYMILTGVVPFNNTSPLDCWLKKTKNDFPPPVQFAPRLSGRVNWAICRAMDANPAARPASCREFMEDLLGTGWRTMQGSGAFMPPSGVGSPDVTTEQPVVPLPPRSGRLGRPSAADTPMPTPHTGTRPDTGGVTFGDPTPAAPDLWYLVYKGQTGELHTVKGLTSSVRKNISAGALGPLNTILVSRTKAGQFQPLRNVPEFRDLVLGSGRTDSASPTANLVETQFVPPESPPPPGSGAASYDFRPAPDLEQASPGSSAQNPGPVLRSAADHAEPGHAATLKVVLASIIGCLLVLGLVALFIR